MNVCRPIRPKTLKQRGRRASLAATAPYFLAIVSRRRFRAFAPTNPPSHTLAVLVLSHVSTRVLRTDVLIIELDEVVCREAIWECVGMLCVVCLAGGQHEACARVSRDETVEVRS